MSFDRLGLVCLTHPDTQPAISYSTLIRSRITAETLNRVYEKNLTTLVMALRYCRDVLGTRLYRMPTGLFPWLDSPDPRIAGMAREILASYAPRLLRVSQEFRLTDYEKGMRVTTHPDQYVMLAPLVVMEALAHRRRQRARAAGPAPITLIGGSTSALYRLHVLGIRGGGR